MGTKYYEGLDVKVQAWRDESASKDNRKNNGEFSPENIDLVSATKGRKETIDRRIWISGEILRTCVIWCKGFPFWHFVTGVSGIRV